MAAHAAAARRRARQYTSHPRAAPSGPVPADPMPPPPTPTDPILEEFAARAASRSGHPVAEAAGQRWTLGDLDRAADALAARLRRQGFGAGRLVGLAAAPGPALLAGFLALRRCAAVPVLCDTARPTPDRLAALDRLGVTGFLAEATGWPEEAAGWELDVRQPPRPRQAEADWGAVKLTSGSTGEPRGVVLSSAALAADEAQLASSMGIAEGERMMAAIPLSHSYGFSSLALPALLRGATLVFALDRSPLAPIGVARDFAVTFFPTVPAWIAALGRLASPPAWPATVRRVIAAGAPLVPEAAARFRAVAGLPVQVFYGASECGGIAFDRVGDAAERGTVGAPVDGVEVAVDAATGRLAVRSRAVATTWLPDPGPDLTGGRFLTGDLASLEAGEVRLLGRADDVLIVRGRNIHPREIEATLRELPGVADVAVLGVDGPEGPRTLLRAVIAAPAGGVDRERVIDFCRQRLAAYKVPRSVVVVAELPRTDRGKPDRAALGALSG